MTVKIGVLGGIGPDATAEFYSKLITKLKMDNKIKANRDFPQIIINSIPAPELVYDEISEDEIKPYVQGLAELDKTSPDFIAMVCNTIHLYYESLQKEITTPIIDLRKEVMEFILNSGIESALILGTQNTIKGGLYKFGGIKYFEPNLDEMSRLSRAIFDFNRGFRAQNQINITREICSKYLWYGS